MTEVVSAAELQVAGDEVSPREILAQQVRMVHSMANRSAWTMSILTVIVAAVLHSVGWPILVWMIAQLLLKLEAYIELTYFFPQAQIDADPWRMARRLMINQPPHAVVWSSLLWIVGAHGTPAELVVVMIVIGGVLSGGVSTYGALPRVHAAYLVVFSAAQLAIYAALGGQIAHDPKLGLAPFLAIFFCFGIYQNTRAAGRSYLQFILLSFANARLARRLEQEVASTRTAQEEAEAANAAKSTFLAAASHDLRQPIHALGLFLALLDRSTLDAQQRETLNLARSALTASFEMLDALLDFSRAEAGVIVPRPHPFRIGEVLRQIEEEVAVNADEKQLFYRTRDCDAVVDADPGLVKIILQNLVTNAIRYTSDGGVLVGCRRRGERIVVEVWDTGIGVPAAQHEAIFSDFIQLGNPERDRRKGLGLGLAIARRLARLIGSEIGLNSREGRGSVFRFDLPLADKDVSVVERGTPHDIMTPRSGGVQVLVIDDDESIRLSLSGLLKATGYSVETAETIDQARASARRTAPDLLICDSRLRGGERGAEAARLIRADVGQCIPALLITGDTHPDRIAEAAREDMEILYKPAPSDLLLAAVARLLART